MKKIIVGIAGDAPLLMHNPLGMGRGTSGGRKVVPSAVDEAAAARYLLPDGKTLCIHADHVLRCLESPRVVSGCARKRCSVPTCRGRSVSRRI